VRNLLTTQKGTAKIRLGFPFLVNVPVLVLQIVHSVPLVLLSTVTLELALFTAWMTPSKRSLAHRRMVTWEYNVMIRGSLIHQLYPFFLITFLSIITHLIVIIGFSSRQISACLSHRVSDHRRLNMGNIFDLMFFMHLIYFIYHTHMKIQNKRYLY